jgi:hypothetical protein
MPSTIERIYNSMEKERTENRNLPVGLIERLDDSFTHGKVSHEII